MRSQTDTRQTDIEPLREVRGHAINSNAAVMQKRGASTCTPHHTCCIWCISFLPLTHVLEFSHDGGRVVVCHDM